MERTYAHLDDGELRVVSQFFISVLNAFCCPKKLSLWHVCTWCACFTLSVVRIGDVSIRIRDNPLLRPANKLLPNEIREKNEPSEKKYQTYVTLPKKNNRQNVQDVVLGMAQKMDTFKAACCLSSSTAAYDELPKRFIFQSNAPSLSKFSASFWH